MKKIFLRLSLLAVITVFFPLQLLAQGPPPPPNPQGVPLDDGLWGLLLVGAAYGLRVYYKRKKKDA